MRKKSLCDQTDIALLKGLSAAKRVLGGQKWPGWWKCRWVFRRIICCWVAACWIVKGILNSQTGAEHSLLSDSAYIFKMWFSRTSRLLTILTPAETRQHFCVVSEEKYPILRRILITHQTSSGMILSRFDSSYSLNFRNISPSPKTKDRYLIPRK